MKKIFMGLIILYQRYLRSFLPAYCRFFPSCSDYTLHAIEKYGAPKGLILGAGRILRCNGFFRGGYDPAC